MRNRVRPPAPDLLDPPPLDLAAALVVAEAARLLARRAHAHQQRGIALVGGLLGRPVTPGEAVALHSRPAAAIAAVVGAMIVAERVRS